eukprot:3409051-Pyramimonas_sp.AAC.1
MALGTYSQRQEPSSASRGALRDLRSSLKVERGRALPAKERSRPGQDGCLLTEESTDSESLPPRSVLEQWDLGPTTGP